MKIETKLKKLAEKYGWKFLVLQENIGMISFVKGDKNRINIYTTTLTVGTCIYHPKKGKTQLFRKHSSLEEIEKLFANPRQHTGRGYYTKKG